jgi:hypothetical protein
MTLLKHLIDFSYKFSSIFMPLMKIKRYIQKGIAIILLVLFSQKMGGGLYLHNWLHSGNCKQTPHTGHTYIISYSCNCIDDFSMPFAEPVAEVLPSIAFPHPVFLPSYTPEISFSFRFFNSLRAPPVSFA